MLCAKNDRIYVAYIYCMISIYIWFQRTLIIWQCPLACLLYELCSSSTALVLEVRVSMFDRQPQSWADGPGAGTFQHTVSPTKNQRKKKEGGPGDAKQGKETQMRSVVCR
jgi:hypothetical protein